MTLGNVTLSDHLILDGLETAPMVAHSQRRTLTGESVVQAAPMVGGRALSLRSENHLTLEQINQVRDLAGQVVSLVHHRGTFSVLVISIDVEAALDHADPKTDDWYSGTINLLEV